MNMLLPQAGPSMRGRTSQQQTAFPLQRMLLILLVLLSQTALAWHHHDELADQSHCVVCLHAEADRALAGDQLHLPVVRQMPPPHREAHRGSLTAPAAPTPSARAPPV